MRYLAFLLVAYLFIITAGPVLGRIFCADSLSSLCCNKSCSKRSALPCSAPKKQMPGSCTNGVCDNTCAVYNVGQTYRFTNMLTGIQKTVIENDTIISSYSSDSWKPPKSVESLS